MITAIRNVLLEHGVEINTEDCCIDAEYTIIFRDKLLYKVQNSLKNTENQGQKAEIIVNEIIATLENVFIFDSWAVKIERESCEGCPALQWVIHEEKVHPCRLGFDIEKKENLIHPIQPCLRPQTVGAGYVIAKILNRPEPMLGKLCCDEYKRYLAEKKGLVQ